VKAKTIGYILKEIFGSLEQRGDVFLKSVSCQGMQILKNRIVVSPFLGDKQLKKSKCAMKQWKGVEHM